MKKIKLFGGIIILCLGLSGLCLMAYTNEGMIFMETDEVGVPEIIYNKPVRGVLLVINTMLRNQDSVLISIIVDYLKCWLLNRRKIFILI